MNRLSFLEKLALVATALSGFMLVVEKLIDISSLSHGGALIEYFFVGASIFALLLLALRARKINVDNDYLGKYTIELLNVDGDAFIEREIESDIASNVYYKSINLFSDTSVMCFNDMKFVANDNLGGNLFFELINDAPSTKEIRIKFDKNKHRKRVIYSYSYYWNGIFPGSDEYYILRDNAPENCVSLVFPKKWDIKCISAQELTADGKLSEVIFEGFDEVQLEDKKIYKFTIKKNNKVNNIKLKWNVSRN